jgi:hypothetical protein
VKRPREHDGPMTRSKAARTGLQVDAATASRAASDPHESQDDGSR